MKNNGKRSSAEQWLTTFTWQDKVIARCFPRFFKKYAPDEIQQQWAEYLRRREKPPKADSSDNKG